jgi:hypothetical protein
MPAEKGRGGLQEKISDLKRRAARARRLMAQMTNGEDRRLLREFAEELEARAVKLGKGCGPTTADD